MHNLEGSCFIPHTNLSSVVRKASFILYARLSTFVFFQTSSFIGKTRCYIQRFSTSARGSSKIYCCLISTLSSPLFQLFNPPGDPVLVWRYVQAHPMKTLAMVADVSEVIFAKARPLAVYALDGSHHSSLS